MRPKSIIIGLSPADDNGICTAQTTAGAAELDLSGGALCASTGIARLGTAATILITCAADESARTFTVTGLDANGRVQVEKIAGVDSTTVASTIYYREVSRVHIDGATTGNVSVGVTSDTDAILTTSTLSQAAAFTLDGIWTYEATMFGIAEINSAAVVKIFSTGNDSGVTFTVEGEGADGTALIEDITGANADTATGTSLFKKVYNIESDGATADTFYAGWADDVDGIAKLQTALGGAAFFVMNGAYCGVQARHVSITSASADESGITFTVVGLNRRGDRITEKITGPTAAATVKGNKNFSIVQAIYVDGALTGNVTVGSADECESAVVPFEYYDAGVAVQITHLPSDSDASVSHRFLDTLDNVLDPAFNEDNATWVEETGTKTVSESLSSVAVIRAARLEITSHVNGVVKFVMAFPGDIN